MLNWQGAGRHERRIQEVLNLIFQNHSQFLAFLFDPSEPRLRQEAEWLLAEAGAFSAGEQILIRIALDLWNGAGKVDLWDIVERLDEENYHNVLAGLRHLRPIEEDGAPLVWRQSKMAYLNRGLCPQCSSSQP
jgi:hypothetical protein